MSKTWRREYIPADPPRPIIKDEEDEDIDPRSYNVIQRYSPERDTRRLETRMGGKA